MFLTSFHILQPFLAPTTFTWDNNSVRNAGIQNADGVFDFITYKWTADNGFHNSIFVSNSNVRIANTASAAPIIDMNGASPLIGTLQSNSTAQLPTISNSSVTPSVISFGNNPLNTSLVSATFFGSILDGVSSISLVKNGENTQAIHRNYNASSDFSGDINVNAGTIQIFISNASLSVPNRMEVASGAKILISGVTNSIISYSGGLHGAGTFSASRYVKLIGVNQFTGNFELKDVFSSGGASDSNCTLQIFSELGTGSYAGNIDLGRGGNLLYSAPLDLQFSGVISQTFYAGVSFAQNININTTNSLNLSGVNTFFSGIKIISGSLKTSFLADIDIACNIGLGRVSGSASAFPAIQLSGGVFNYHGPSVSVNRRIDLTSASTIEIQTGSYLTLNSYVQTINGYYLSMSPGVGWVFFPTLLTHGCFNQATNGELIKTGGGDLKIFTKTSWDYSGTAPYQLIPNTTAYVPDLGGPRDYTISNGILRFGDAGKINNVTINSPGTLSVQDSDITIAGSVYGNGTMSISNNDVLVNGAIYGNILIDTSTGSIGSIDADFDAAYSIVNTIYSGYTYKVSGTYNPNITNNGIIISYGTVFNGLISGSGSVTSVGNSTLNSSNSFSGFFESTILQQLSAISNSGVNSYIGSGSSIHGGFTYTGATASCDRNISLSTQIATTNQLTLSGIIDGTSLTISGSGTVVLTGTNTFGNFIAATGTTSVSTLNDSGSASNLGTGTIQLLNGKIQYTGVTVSSNRSIILGQVRTSAGQAPQSSAPMTVSVTGPTTTATITGNITANSRGFRTFTKDGSGAFTLSGAITNGSFFIDDNIGTFSVLDGELSIPQISSYTLQSNAVINGSLILSGHAGQAISGVVSGNGTIKHGGTLTLSGLSNTFSGTIDSNSITSGGTQHLVVSSIGLADASAQQFTTSSFTYNSTVNSTINSLEYYSITTAGTGTLSVQSSCVAWGNYNGTIQTAMSIGNGSTLDSLAAAEWHGNCDISSGGTLILRNSVAFGYVTSGYITGSGKVVIDMSSNFTYPSSKITCFELKSIGAGELTLNSQTINRISLGQIATVKVSTATPNTSLGSISFDIPINGASISAGSYEVTSASSFNMPTIINIDIPAGSITPGTNTSKLIVATFGETILNYNSINFYLNDNYNSNWSLGGSDTVNGASIAFTASSAGITMFINS